MTIRIEVHAEDPMARWRASADVVRPGSETADQYGGYGSSPLEAVMDLAKDLANVAILALKAG